MSNSYYNHGSYPTTGAPGASASLRSELDSITSGFNLLPTISGNGNKAVIVNSGATALSVTTGTLALAGNFATTGAYNTTLIQGATTSLTLPLVSGTLATLAGTEEFTNKTLTSAIAKGTWTASGTWTLPALTLGGAITYGGVTLSNAVTGTNNMVLSASPTLTGTIAAASQTLSGTFGVTGVATFTAQPIMSSLTASKPVFTDASKGLTSTGTLAYDQGGTGQTSYAAGDIIYASGVNTLTKLAIGTTGQHLIVSGGVPSWSTDATIGTVTSVGWTGGIVSVATATTTPAFTIAGTSGGVPYFDSGTTWATSAALAANALVLGGGAGAAPATTTTGTGVVTALGVNTGSAGAIVLFNGALGTPTSGTATNLTGLPLTTGVTGTLPVANGGTGLTLGTSGGILAYTATGTLASSALLAANALMIGGGAGVAPSTTTTGTGVVTALGVNTGTAGAFVVNGGALGTPSSGTVTNLTGTASININGTVGATTATTGAFTTLSASGTTTAAAINASGLVAMAGAATVGTTLGVTGTSTMAAINASGAVTITKASVDPQATATGVLMVQSNSGLAINKGGSISLDGVYTGTSITQFGYIKGWKENATDGNYAGYIEIGTRPNGSTSLPGISISSSQAVTIPGTLGVTGQTTATGNLLIGSGTIQAWAGPVAKIGSRTYLGQLNVNSGSYFTSNLYFDGTNWRTEVAAGGGFLSLIGDTMDFQTSVSGGALGVGTLVSRFAIASGGAVTIPGTLGVTGNITVGAGSKFTTDAGNDLNLDAPSSRSLFLKIGGSTKVTVDNAGAVQQGGSVTHLLSVSALAYELRGNATGAETVYGNSTGTGKMSVGYLQGNDKGYCIAGAPALVLGASNVGSVEVSSTGLSVTGTLGVTGAISTATSVISAQALPVFALNRTGGDSWLIRNNSDSFIIGNNDSGSGTVLTISRTGIVSTGAASVVNAAGYEIVLPNNLYLRGATAANTNTIPLIKVNSSNGITIGTVSGADVVTTSGQFRTEYAWANTGGTTTVMVDSNGSLFKLASARKYKMDFAPYSKGLADVLKLDPQYYRIKSQGEDSHIYAGLIADDLDAQGLSEFVAYGPEGVDSINYGHMAALFANAIKELAADFEAYKNSHP